jgi:hypothetical protein
MSATLTESTALAEEVRRDDADTFATMVRRLSRLSVDKHFDAYADIDWDAPEMALDPADPRLRVPSCDPLAATAWYQGQAPELQSRIGLFRFAACMKIGWHFENLLQRGLLHHAIRLPNGSPEFRYVHHEIIEESQHTLMFQEFVNRTRLPVRGMPWIARKIAELGVETVAAHAPALFFVLVLGGEDPADYLQRSHLRDDQPHPLVERIMRIHVTEEARHLSFARHFLKREVPRLNAVRRHLLAVTGPLVLGVMARLMLAPSPDLVRHCAIPRSVVREAMASPQGHDLLAGSVEKTRKLWAELGLMTPASRATWKAMGIWAD